MFVYNYVGPNLIILGKHIYVTTGYDFPNLTILAKECYNIRDIKIFYGTLTNWFKKLIQNNRELKKCVVKKMRYSYISNFSITSLSLPDDMETLELGLQFHIYDFDKV